MVYILAIVAMAFMLLWRYETHRADWMEERLLEKMLEDAQREEAERRALGPMEIGGVPWRE
jgi:hypothetical protein